MLQRSFKRCPLSRSSGSGPRVESAMGRSGEDKGSWPPPTGVRSGRAGAAEVPVDTALSHLSMESPAGEF